jgi:hypothetical protein
MVGSQSYVKRFMSSNSASLGISGEADCGFFLGQHNPSNAGSRLKCVRWIVCGCAAQCGYFNKQVFFECADKKFAAMKNQCRAAKSFAGIFERGSNQAF